MSHAVGTLPKFTTLARTVPFISQIERAPESLCCQRMSGLPSPLKSSEPTMFQWLSTVPKLTLLVWTVPFINQMERAPEVCCQRRSPLPSPLKSPTPIMFHDVAKVPRLTLPMKVVPFIIQTVRSPVDLFCQKIFGVAYSADQISNP